MTAPTTAETVVRVRTGAWYSDAPLDLCFPEGWEVQVHRPFPPAPLTADEVASAVRNPVAGPPLRELANGAHQVAILVDDLTRPTPAAAILPHILSELVAAGVPSSAVTVLVATGAHRVSLDARVLRAKLGSAAMDSCRVVVHDHRGATIRVGATSYGTPIHLDRVVAGCDLMVGVGGVYPQHTVGFGGGAKIVLGALGTRSIAALHYKHHSGNGDYNVDNDFRHDVSEMAGIVGLRFVVLGHVDADRALVRVAAGEPVAIHGAEVEFARRVFRTPLPGDADLVVANAYPMDVSLTFAMSKGVIPLTHARPGASRVLVAACTEGVGRHDLFPVQPSTKDRIRHAARKIAADPVAVPSKASSSLRRLLRAHRATASSSPRTPIMWFSGRPQPAAAGLVPVDHWADVLDRAVARHGNNLKVVVYPCAPLQVLDLEGSEPRPATSHDAPGAA